MRGGGRRAYWCFRGKFYARAVFPLGKVRPGFFFPRGKLYTGILFPGAILSRSGFSGGGVLCGGNSMLQHRAFIADATSKLEDPRSSRVIDLNSSNCVNECSSRCQCHCILLT